MCLIWEVNEVNIWVFEFGFEGEGGWGSESLFYFILGWLMNNCWFV